MPKIESIEPTVITLPPPCRSSAGWAACAVKKDGVDVRPEIMIPLSSTVTELRFLRERLIRVAKKVFEEKGGMGSHYGRVAIGVLIVQDIAAVVFLAASMAKVPSPWAAAIIIALILSKPLLVMLLKRAGHGELLILYGLVLALGGSALFEFVSLKGDLGALFFGILLAHHPKAAELAKTDPDGAVALLDALERDLGAPPG